MEGTYGMQEEKIVTLIIAFIKAEHDTREEWADLTQKSSKLSNDWGGIGIDYSILRPSGNR